MKFQIVELRRNYKLRWGRLGVGKMVKLTDVKSGQTNIVFCYKVDVNNEMTDDR